MFSEAMSSICPLGPGNEMYWIVLDGHYESALPALSEAEAESLSNGFSLGRTDVEVWAIGSGGDVRLVSACGGRISLDPRVEETLKGISVFGGWTNQVAGAGSPAHFGLLCQKHRPSFVQPAPHTVWRGWFPLRDSWKPYWGWGKEMLLISDDDSAMGPLAPDDFTLTRFGLELSPPSQDEESFGDPPAEIPVWLIFSPTALTRKRGWESRRGRSVPPQPPAWEVYLSLADPSFVVPELEDVHNAAGWVAWKKWKYDGMELWSGFAGDPPIFPIPHWNVEKGEKMQIARIEADDPVAPLLPPGRRIRARLVPRERWVRSEKDPRRTRKHEMI